MQHLHVSYQLTRNVFLLKYNCIIKGKFSLKKKHKKNNENICAFYEKLNYHALAPIYDQVFHFKSHFFQTKIF